METGKPFYASPEPYPPLKTAGENHRWAELLRWDLASSQSEMTAVTEYLYNSWILQGEYPQIAETMRQVAMVEMRHVNMLGGLIVRLGGNPGYAMRQNNAVRPWSGAMPPYGKQLKQMMQQNITAERAAIDQYTRQIQVIEDPGVRAVLKRIILDEKVHIEIFQKHLNG